MFYQRITAILGINDHLRPQNIPILIKSLRRENEIDWRGGRLITSSHTTPAEPTKCSAVCFVTQCGSNVLVYGSNHAV